MCVCVGQMCNSLSLSVAPHLTLMRQSLSVSQGFTDSTRLAGWLATGPPVSTYLELGLQASITAWLFHALFKVLQGLLHWAPIPGLGLTLNWPLLLAPQAAFIDQFQFLFHAILFLASGLCAVPCG